MINFQDSFKNLFDVDALQANFAKAYDVNAVQENLKKLYDVEAFQENLAKLTDNDALKLVKDYAESIADKELVEKSVKLTANLVAANVNAVTDATILQSVQLRDRVEGALKQADTLVNSKDLQAAFEAQKSYVAEQQEVAVENFWTKAGLVTGLVENNLNLLKEAFEQVQPATKAA